MLDREMRAMIRGQYRNAAFRTGAPPAQLLPPQLFQTQFIREVGRRRVGLGATEQFDMQRLGYADGLLIMVEHQYDIAVGGSALVSRAPFQAVSRLLLQPPGAQPVWNADGWQTFLQNLLSRDLGGHVDRGLISRSKVEGNGFVNGVTRNALADLVYPNVANVADQTGRLFYFVPFHRSAYHRLGNLPMGNQTTTSLFVTMGALADIFATPANLTHDFFDVTVSQVIFSPPQRRPDVARPNADFIFTVEQQVQAAVLGDNAVDINPHDTIVNIIHTIELNAALNSADLESISLAFDQSLKYNGLRARTWWKLQEDRLGYAAPIGVIFHDFDHMVDMDGAAAQALGQLAIPYNLAAAEWVHTERISTITSTPRIAATAVLGATPRVWTSIRRLARVRG